MTQTVWRFCLDLTQKGTTFHSKAVHNVSAQFLILLKSLLPVQVSNHLSWNYNLVLDSSAIPLPLCTSSAPLKKEPDGEEEEEEVGATCLLGEVDKREGPPIAHTL